MRKSLFSTLLAVVLPFVAFAENPPLMGWSSWNTYGFQINDSVIKAQADAMVALGFNDCGYNHINIDDGFFGGRDANGKHDNGQESNENRQKPFDFCVFICG